MNNHYVLSEGSSFREKCPRPSDAVIAMIDGLEKVLNGRGPEGLEIDMGTFGSYHPRTQKCLVCAATAAAMQALGLWPTSDEVVCTLDENVLDWETDLNSFGQYDFDREQRAEFFMVSFRDLNAWEHAFENCRRQGSIHLLGELYYGSNASFTPFYAVTEKLGGCKLPSLTIPEEPSWSEHFVEWRRFANRLSQAGF